MSVSRGMCVFHATMGTRIPDVTRRSPTQAHAHLQDLFLFADAQKESEGVMREEVRGCEQTHIYIHMCLCVGHLALETGGNAVRAGILVVQIASCKAFALQLKA